MASQEEPDLYELARGQVSSQQGEAAEIAEKIIATALKSAKGKQETRMVVRRTCRGAMSGLILAKKNHWLPDAAISLLRAMARLADQFNLLPTDMMTWCMEGIADVTAIAGPESAAAIQSKIQVEFMGAEDIFKEFCQKAVAKNWWTK